MRIDRHKKKILAFIAALAALPAVGLAAGSETHVEKANNDIHNQASLQRARRIRQLLPRGATRPSTCATTAWRPTSA